MATWLCTSLQDGGLTRYGLHRGLSNLGLFNGASLDLPFADTKSLVDAVTGQSLVTFTRASSGTNVGSDGLIKTATTNLGIYSDVSQSSYIENITVTSNNATSPDGTSNATRLTSTTTGTSNSNLADRNVAVSSNTVYTFSCYLKQGNTPLSSINLWYGGGTYREVRIAYTWSSKTIALTGTAGTGFTGSATEVGNGWVRLVVSLDSGNNTTANARIHVRDNTTSGVTGDFVYAWGRQLEQSSTVGEYIPTTSTINSAPRFDHAITSSVTNVIWPSEDFTTTWGVAFATRFADAGIAPNGTLTADRIESTGGGVFRSGVSVLSGVSYTYSVYVKHVSGTGVINTIGFERFGAVPLAGQTSFNVLTGTVVSNGAAVTASSITPVGDGWYRVSVRATSTDITTTIVNYTSVSGNQFLLWGAQLEQSSTAGEYVQTTSAPATANKTESLGLLVEEQRTNSIRNNTMVGAVAGTPGTAPTNWSIGGNSGLTYSVIGTGTDNGIQYIDIRFNGTTAAVAVPEATIGFEPSTAVAAVQNQTWTGSAYVKIVGGSLSGIIGGELFVIETNISGALTGASSSTYNYSQLTGVLPSCRVSHTRTLTGATTAFVVSRVDINFIAGGGSVVDCTLRIGLPQLEQGAFATSVIPTTGAAATRSADVASITGANFSSWYRQDEGTVFADLVTTSRGYSAYPRLVGIFGSNIDASNEFAIYTRNIGTADDYKMYGIVTDGSVAGDFNPPASTPVGSGRVALSAKQNDGAFTVNGLTPVTDNTLNMPTSATQLLLFSNARYQPRTSGTIRRLVYWGQRLPNNVLQAITQ